VLKLGTGVLLVQQRDAIHTAKLVASIDRVSQGRFLFGVGGGWNQDEMTTVSHRTDAAGFRLLSHVGGAFPYGPRRAIRYRDGWIPTARGDLAEVLPNFREMVREAGRDPASIEITLFGLAEDLDRVKRLAEMGVTRVVPMFLPEKAHTVLPIVERWTKIMRQVNG
jgi:alkanesulfonate monooxygenase SsuD/methylene tetrahydromethanopterin reductase-like flavin-dependent oxidoreductase (luciferase family)